MNIHKIDNQLRLQRLKQPVGVVDAILDTDTYNEIDDQFALAYSLMCNERINLTAVCAAPFTNNRSTGPDDGMEKSYQEILTLLERMNIKHSNYVFRGSKSYLPDRNTPVESESATEIIRQAMAARETGKPLYVMAIGAITNVASAILIEPAIIESIVVVWLGAQPFYWEHNNEFNLNQDVPAAQVVLDSGVPFVLIPCHNVAQHIKTSVPEMERYVKGRGEIGNFLFGRFCDYSDNHVGWTKEIWDLAAPAYLKLPECLPSQIVPSPVMNDDKSWDISDKTRHPIRVITDIRRDGIFRDLFAKLDEFAKK